MRSFVAVIMTAVLCAAMAGTPVANAAEGDIGKGIGYLIKKMALQIVLEEFPEDSEDTVEVTYTINDQTRFMNFDSLDDINEFDDLEIEYKVVRGQKQALSIFRSQSYEDYSGELDIKEGEMIEDFSASDDI